MATQTTQRAGEAGTQVARTAAGQGRQVAETATDEVKDLASTATDRGGALVRVATTDARQLAGTVRERASEVTSAVTEQGRSLVVETRSQLEGQAQAGAQRLAGAFRQIGEEAQALAEGRPDDAPALSGYVERAADGAYGAADRLYSLAQDVETRGFSGVLDDLQGFARRRPGAFLVGAAAVGFTIGRFVKAEAAERQSADDEDEALVAAPVAPQSTRRAPATGTGTRRTAGAR